ncbi:MAG: H-NS histone family protein [Burkholderiales bacterium]|nr:H-NS histone family protein [Burkholderiales bacterium]
MAKTLAQIQKQIDALQREADAIRNHEKSGVIDRIKEAIAHYGITAAELGFGGRAAKSTPQAGKPKAAAKGAAAGAKPRGAKKGTVPVKYRDDAGNTWTGRGSQPKWFRAALEAGKKPEDFKV